MATAKVRHAVTAKVEQIVRTVIELGHEIEPHLHLVSQAARDEWTALQNSLPAPEQLQAGAIALTETELEIVEAKVRRFRDIVRALGRLPPAAPTAVRTANRRAGARAQVTPTGRSTIIN
jgi:hypothetical protein